MCMHTYAYLRHTPRSSRECHHSDLQPSVPQNHRKVDSTCCNICCLGGLPIFCSFPPQKTGYLVYVSVDIIIRAHANSHTFTYEHTHVHVHTYTKQQLHTHIHTKTSISTIIHTQTPATRKHNKKQTYIQHTHTYTYPHARTHEHTNTRTHSKHTLRKNHGDRIFFA